MTNRIFLFIFLLLSTLISYTSNAQTIPGPVEQKDGEPFIVENTIIHKVLSEVVPDQVYEIRVAVPDSYQSSPDKEYPIVVVLDGQWNFNLGSDVVYKLGLDGVIPEAITVAITWGGEGDNPDILRFRDLIRPVHDFLPLSGGAELFLASLTEELIPYVEDRYRVGGKRVLLGVSLGGLFTSYAMVEKPGFFDGYIAIAGSYQIDGFYLDGKLEELSGSKALKGVRSFLTVGSLDPNEIQVATLNNSIKAAKLKGFKHKHKVFKGFGHSGAEPLAYTYGLRYIFKRPALKLSEEFLQQYAGNYEGGVEGFPPFPITVSVAGVGKLLIGDEFQQLEYKADTQSTFYVDGSKVTASFPEEDQFIIDSAGTLLHFNRVVQE